jgi:hypothetical protein
MGHDANRDRRLRRPLRLKHYDYSQPGAYFVTLCPHRRLCIFGVIAGEEMRLEQGQGFHETGRANPPTSS